MIEIILDWTWAIGATGLDSAFMVFQKEKLYKDIRGGWMGDALL
jgi:hypothetical protein